MKDKERIKKIKNEVEYKEWEIGTIRAVIHPDYLDYLFERVEELEEDLAYEKQTLINQEQSSDKKINSLKKQEKRNRTTINEITKFIESLDITTGAKEYFRNILRK